jgi:hypothetical protein
LFVEQSHDSIPNVLVVESDIDFGFLFHLWSLLHQPIRNRSAICRLVSISLSKSISRSLRLLRHGTSIAINQLLYLQTALLLQRLKVFNDPFVLIINVYLVVQHELFDLLNLSLHKVQLDLIGALLMQLDTIPLLSIAHRTLQHVAVNVALTLINRIDKALRLRDLLSQVDETYLRGIVLCFSIAELGIGGGGIF